MKPATWRAFLPTEESSRCREEREQRVIIHGLRDVVVQPGCTRPPAGLLLTVAGSGNQHGFPTALLPPEVLRHLVAGFRIAMEKNQRTSGWQLFRDTLANDGFQ